jgi:hypothetical protein
MNCHASSSMNDCHQPLVDQLPDQQLLPHHVNFPFSSSSSSSSFSGFTVFKQ